MIPMGETGTFSAENVPVSCFVPRPETPTDHDVITSVYALLQALAFPSASNARTQM
jgi:hypothetical protein